MSATSLARSYWNCHLVSEMKTEIFSIAEIIGIINSSLFLLLYQVCTENSFGSIPPFTQRIAFLADVRLGGTLKA